MKYSYLQFLVLFFLLYNNVLILSPRENYDKWFVITTINKPTAVFEKLSKLKDWHGVVVADKKTPKDWNVPGITFLSVEYQQTCKYKIAQLLPWNHYGRKNIGYLYAIEHGAKLIYETDDDNFILNETIDYLPEYTDCLVFDCQKNCFNPYAYFGQPSVWPRGYPLKEICKTNRVAVQKKNKCFIPIQQGLVNNDPDVDAIFRLTRNQLLEFDSGIPPAACAMGTMAPFNSQNTIFYYSSFWALLMPISVTSRVADIWRGYWAQRLLWDIGGSLCFLPPTAIQERNEHDFLNDFEQELDLYLQVDNLIKKLNQWQSTKNNFFECMHELLVFLTDNNFLKKNDLELAKTWIEDLIELGYEPPILSNKKYQI